MGVINKTSDRVPTSHHSARRVMLVKSYMGRPSRHYLICVTSTWGSNLWPEEGNSNLIRNEGQAREENSIENAFVFGKSYHKMEMGYFNSAREGRRNPVVDDDVVVAQKSYKILPIILRYITTCPNVIDGHQITQPDYKIYQGFCG